MPISQRSSKRSERPNNLFQNKVTQGESNAVVYRVECEKGNVLMALSVNGQEKINGISFRPTT